MSIDNDILYLELGKIGNFNWWETPRIVKKTRITWVFKEDWEIASRKIIITYKWIRITQSWSIES